jgi:hypothetical protein
MDCAIMLDAVLRLGIVIDCPGHREQGLCLYQIDGIEIDGFVVCLYCLIVTALIIKGSAPIPPFLFSLLTLR